MRSFYEKDILKILNLEDDGSYTIEDIIYNTIDFIIEVIVSKILIPLFCPVCGQRLKSKGPYTRKAVHPVKQDGYQIYIIAKQRKWYCKHCDEYFNEQFPFLDRYSHHTNITNMSVLDYMKDLRLTTRQIAELVNMSDTEVHNIFSTWVDLNRLPLTEFISIDEVYIKTSHMDLYALVIMDFITGQIIDILPNRLQDTYTRWFLSIPYCERAIVKVVISDAYGPYLNFNGTFFPNARPALDSFHVMSKLIGLIIGYINAVYSRFKKIDDERLERINEHRNIKFKSIAPSRECVLLKDYRWILLKNADEISYSSKLYYNRHLGMNVDTHRIEDMFMKIDDNFSEIRDLKEMYVDFNHTQFNDEESALAELDELIKVYEASHIKLFNTFADYLKEHRESIARSFSIVEVSRRTIDESTAYYARLSNGPMESFNRKPKDLKRQCRGLSNFDYTRNRILWATRINPPILGIPKTYQQIHSYRGKKRGKYNKKKNKKNKN